MVLVCLSHGGNHGLDQALIDDSGRHVLVRVQSIHTYMSYSECLLYEGIYICTVCIPSRPTTAVYSVRTYHIVGNFGEMALSWHWQNLNLAISSLVTIE